MPFWPNAGPTGGVGVAFPAPIISLIVWTGFAMVKNAVGLVVVILVLLLVAFPIEFSIFKKKVKLDFKTLPLLGVLLLWMCQIISWETVLKGVIGYGTMHPFSIMVLFYSLAYIALSLDQTGVFKFLAFYVSRHARQGKETYIRLFLLFTFIAIWVGNDPVILSGSPFLVYFVDAAAIQDPTSWLFGEFIAANIASMLLVIGNPTNVLVAEAFELNFGVYTLFMGLPFLVSCISALLILLFQFRNFEHIPDQIEPPKVDYFSFLIDKNGAIFGSVVFLLALVTLFVTSFVGIDVWMVSLPFGLLVLFRDVYHDIYNENLKGTGTSPDLELQPCSAHVAVALTRHKVEECISTLDNQEELNLINSKKQGLQTLNPIKDKVWTRRFKTCSSVLSRLPYSMLPFALSMFVLVQSLDDLGWIDEIASRLSLACSSTGLSGTVVIIGLLTVLLCNFAGTNIGSTLVMIKVLQSRAFSQENISMNGAIYALAFGSNVGAFSLSIAGSLAGLLWQTILGQKGIQVTPLTFVKWNILPLFVVLLSGLATIWIQTSIFG